MKITCEHCGSGIDTEKNEVCPNCGAPYNDNKEYKKVREYEQRKNEADIKTREAVGNMFERVNKQQKVAPIIVIIVFLLIVTIAYFGFRNINNISNNYNLTTNDNDNEEKSATFNENIEYEEYEIKCDGIKKTNTKELSVFDNKNNNSTYYSFHIVFKNKDGKIHTISDIDLTYTDENGNEDVVANKSASLSITDSLELIVMEKHTYTGYVTFEIPNNVNDVQIHFNNSTIKIINFRDLVE